MREEYTEYPEWNRLIEMIERLKPLMGVEHITILTDSSKPEGPCAVYRIGPPV